MVHRNLVDDNSPQEISKMPDMLQCLRTIQCTNDNSPRDSAPAKRVEELIARKSFFSNDGEAEQESCQALSFAEED